MPVFFTMSTRNRGYSFMVLLSLCLLFSLVSLANAQMGPPPGGNMGPQPGGQNFQNGMPNGSVNNQFDPNKGGQPGMPNGIGGQNGQNFGNNNQFGQGGQPVGQFDPSKGGQPEMNGKLGLDGGEFESEQHEKQRLAMEKQHLSQAKKQISGVQKGLKQFEVQIKRLQAQKVVVPTAISEKLNKVKAVIAQAASATTLDELSATGADDLQDLLGDLQDSRQDLEMLSRWAPTIKQVDKQLAQLTKRLAKSKTVVDKLAKSGIGVGSAYTNFEGVIAKLKTARQDAANQVEAGDVQAGFETLQNDFFESMEDLGQYERVIETMNNLRKFEAQFKSGIKQADKNIIRLEKSKKDVTELKNLRDEAKATGEQILVALKSGDVDTEDISSKLEELEDFKQQFESALGEFAGSSGQSLPWQQGGNNAGSNNFSVPSVGKDFNSFFGGSSGDGVQQ